MRPLIEARLVDPSGQEPGLLLELAERRRVLLFDLGEISRLAPRILLKVTQAFVTHAHMDHFAGFDHLLAVALGRVRRLELFGGPDFIARVEHKLRAYAWNVVHRYEIPLQLHVHELWPDGRRAGAMFDSSACFERQDGPASGGAGDVLHDEPGFRVRGRFVDHEMPVLALALEEKARLRVDSQRLREHGLASGPWLGRLKDAVLSGAPADTPIPMHWRDRAGEHNDERTVGELAPLLRDSVAGRCIGYVTDLRFTEDNLAQLDVLLRGVDRLYIESVFLHEDEEHARRKNHLTARQAGLIARRLDAKELVPFHFSPRYQSRLEDPKEEARSAWLNG